jgi:hypothetical protein
MPLNQLVNTKLNWRVQSFQMAYHIIPCRDDRLHVQIAWEECYNAIRHNLTVFNKYASKVANHGWIIPDFKPGTDSNLVASSSDYLDPVVTTYPQDNERIKPTKGKKALRVSVIG